MRKPIEQKPPLAAWATVARDEAGMSVEEVVDALQARGHAVTAATLRGIEGGSKGASVRLRRLLSAIYDKPVPGDAPLVPAGQDAVALAIDRQTAATDRQTEVLRELIGLLRLDRQAQATLAERVAVIEAFAGQHEGRSQDAPPPEPERTSSSQSGSQRSAALRSPALDP
jgi:hypothetical protein